MLFVPVIFLTPLSLFIWRTKSLVIARFAILLLLQRPGEIVIFAAVKPVLLLQLAKHNGNVVNNNIGDSAESPPTAVFNVEKIKANRMGIVTGFRLING